MQHILVPTDFSTTATKALRLALYLSGKAKGTIMLCHVYTPVESTFIDTEEKRRKHNEATREESYRELEQLKAAVAAETPDVAISTCVERTPLVENLIESAKRNGCQLIVMGTHGATGMKKVVIGSVASEVAGESKLPVLLVPEAYNMHPLKRIVFATNLKAGELIAMEQTLQLAQTLGAHLTVVHVCPTKSGPEEKGEKCRLFHELMATSMEQYRQVPVTFQLLSSDAPYEILEHLDEQFPYDLLVIVRRKKGLLEDLFSKSLAKNISFATTHPLLIFPPSAA